MEIWEQIGISYETLEIVRFKRLVGASASDLGRYLAERGYGSKPCEFALRAAFYAPGLFRVVSQWWRGELDDETFERTAGPVIEASHELWDRPEA